MTYALVKPSATRLERTANWVELQPDERKRRATQAARDRDGDTLWGLCEAWLTLYGTARSQISPNTLRAYRSAQRQWLIGMSGEGLLQIGSDAARLWLERLEVSPSSAMVKLAGVRALYGALRWARATEIDPLKDLKPARNLTARTERSERYSDAEVEQLLLHASDPRDHLLVLLGGHGGLRVSEACALRPSHVDLRAGRLRVVRGKGGKTRSVRLSRRLAAALEGFSPVAQTYLGFGDDWARIRLRALCGVAGVPYRAVHSLRHASGSRLYAQTRDLLMVAKHLGHAGVETAQIYAKWDEAQLEREIQDW